MSLRSFTTVRECFWLYCFPVCWFPNVQVWSLFLLCLSTSYHLIIISFLSLDMGYLFWVGSRVLLWMVFNSSLRIQCSCRRWVHVLLLCHLEPEAKPKLWYLTSWNTLNYLIHTHHIFIHHHGCTCGWDLNRVLITGNRYVLYLQTVRFSKKEFNNQYVNMLYRKYYYWGIPKYLQ